MTAAKDTEDTRISSAIDDTAIHQVDAPPPAQKVRPRDESMRTLWPFLGAAAVVGVILVAIVVSGLSSPRVSDPERVVRAVQTFVAAHNGDDAAAKKAASCSGFDMARSPLAGLAGKVGLVRTDEPKVNGDRAQIGVTVRGDGAAERTGQWNLSKTGGGWLVCG